VPAIEGAPDAVSAGPSKRPKSRFNVSSIPDYTILFALLALFITLAIASSAFLTKDNLLNIADQWTPICFMSLGGTLVIIAGGFDLSIGAMFAIAGIVSIQIANSVDVPVGLVCGVLVGGALGLVNGFLVSVIRMNTFVATIGTSIVLSGLAVVMTNGNVVVANANSFGLFGTTTFLGVKLDIWLMLVGIAACSLLMNRLSLGRYIRAIGGNIDAARLSGVRTEWVRTTTFLASGLGCGIAGVIVASRSISANANAFSGSQYSVWTALLIGGNSMYGGEGAIWRTVVGVALLALIGDGFDLINVDPLYQQIVTGGILLVAVAIDMLIRQRRTS
jgi:ribose transport system permease protein